MKTVSIIVLTILVVLLSAPVHSQYTKPVYVSMPSAGNLQHLPLAAAKFKGFYNEMGITNAQLVFLRGNSINVQALVAGNVQFASAFGRQCTRCFAASRSAFSSRYSIRFRSAL